MVAGNVQVDLKRRRCVTRKRLGLFPNKNNKRASAR